jgi:aminoglycoside 3-N-acetyltransferase
MGRTVGSCCSAGHDRNTSIHIAEYRADLEHAIRRNTVPIQLGGETKTVTYEDLETDSSDFAELEAGYEQQSGIETGANGAATAKLLEQPSLVDFAVDWAEANRTRRAGVSAVPAVRPC